MNKDLINELALVTIQKGVNVLKGQQVVITAPAQCYEFVRLLTKHAYDKGASEVVVDFIDEIVSKYKIQYANEEKLSNVPNYVSEKIKYLIDEKACFVRVLCEDPDCMNGVVQERIKISSLAAMQANKPRSQYLSKNLGQWTIVAYPHQKWANKVFPNLSDEDAMKSLFEAIIKTSRIEKGKSLDNWDKHNDYIQEYSKKMNNFNFKELHFKNSLGTDLHVGLIKDHIWEGGCDRASNGAIFNPNIPTEEIFTMPNRFEINGKVVSTKPLSYQGKLISRFELTFKDGVVVDYKADDNLEVLRQLLETDEGSKSLGEVALISHDSPISNLNILFYETLFDENASCHLALGACYPTNVKGGVDLSREELYKLGGNDSLNHVDFMFGSACMNIVGTKEEGSVVTVFKDGNFVI